MGDQEKIMWNFHGSWFLALQFPSGVKHNFVDFRGVCEASFCPEFTGLKILNSQCLDFFSGIAHYVPTQ